MIIKRDRAHSPWDSLPSGRLVADADEQAVRDFIELGVQAGRVSDEFTNASDVLTRLGMIALDGTLTNAAAVAFCKAPSAYPRMKLGLLAGNDKLDILDLRQEFLPLIPLLKRAELFVVSNIRRKFVFGEPGMQRREVPEIPREAVREAIPNALCHRDYATGTSVQVNVYMDFIEIVSPGLLPEGDSPERHLEGSGGDFKQRNPNIAQVLFRSGMIEQYGTGIPRIKRACDVAGVAFSYRQGVNATVIRFERTRSQVNDRGNIAADGTTVIAANPSALEGLNEAEKTAVQIARDSGRVTKKALMEQAGVGRTKATKTLKQLAEKGVLAWVSRGTNDPYQYYRLNENA